MTAKSPGHLAYEAALSPNGAWGRLSGEDQMLWEIKAEHEAEIASKDALIADLAKALTRLLNESDGLISAFGDQIRHITGNTNIACIKDAMIEANAALARARGNT